MKHVQLFFFCLWIPVAHVLSAPGDQLVLLQAVWRHGDRTPTRTYPNDPNQEDEWYQGWGQLTPLGMQEHFSLGRKIYKKYHDEMNFLSDGYHSSEIYVRSTDKNRTIISAMSNLIGMYNGRKSEIAGIDFPVIDGWPPGFVPIAVHTVEDSTDHIGNPHSICPRHKWLWEQAKKTPEFVALKKENQDLLDELSRITGQNVTLDNLWVIQDATFIEQKYNKRTDINDELYERLTKVNDMAENMKNGLNLGVYDGINFRVELPKVRGGSMLWSIIDHMDHKITCLDPQNTGKSFCKWMNKLKYFVYSAHDTTLASLLSTWGAKIQVLPQGNPRYSAAILIELWKTSGGYKIKVDYHPHFETGFESITHFIDACENISPGSKCSYEAVREGAKQFYPGDPAALCEDVTSKSTPGWPHGVQFTTPAPCVPQSAGPPGIGISSGFFFLSVGFVLLFL